MDLPDVPIPPILPPVLPPLTGTVFQFPSYQLVGNDNFFLLNQLFLQMELLFQQIVEICRNDGQSDIRYQLQSFFQAKLDEINQNISLLASDSNEFLDDSSPRTTARKVEQIKKEVQRDSFPIPKTFKLRADAPPFVPTNVSTLSSNTVEATSPPPAPGLQRPTVTLNSYSKAARKSSTSKSFGNNINSSVASTSKVSALLWSGQRPTPEKDDWDEDSIRDEVTKASEQIWQEAEAWIEAAMLAEEEEWKFLELGINQTVGLSNGRYSTTKDRSLSVTNPDDIVLDGLLIETSFDVAAESLLASSPVENSALFETPGKPEEGSPVQSSKYSSPPTRSLHQKLSSPDRKRALSPTAAKRRYEAKLQAAENNRDKSVAEKVQKAMIASNRVKEILLREARRQAEAGEALQEKLQNAELRHSERLNQIKEKAVSENAKVLGVSLVNSQNSEALARHVQQKLEEVEAKILAANLRREQRLEEISGSQRKKNTRRAQQMSEFRLLLEKEKMERWEKLQKRFEAVQERRKKRLEELKRRAEAVESTGASVPSLARLTLVDDAKLAKTIEAYSPKVSFNCPEPVSNDISMKTAIDSCSPNTSNPKESPVVEEQESRNKPSSEVIGTHSSTNTLSYDGLDNTPPTHYALSSPSFKVLDSKINMSNSEEIELVLFPAVAKAHAKFIELIKRAKVMKYRSQTILAGFTSIDCDPNNVYYQTLLALLRPEDSILLRSPSKMITSDEVSAIQKKEDDLSPFHQFIESIEDTRKFMNSEERGASSYNIYASIIKELRTFGLNCNMDLIEKINFLMTKMMDSSRFHYREEHPTSSTHSLEIEDFLRSGGMLLFPVLLSYEYGVLSDLSNIQNFINSIIIFTRNSHHHNSQSEQGSPVPPSYLNKDPGLSPDIIQIKKYKKAMIQQFVQQTFALKPAVGKSNGNVMTNEHQAAPIFQQIDFYNVIDLLSLILREYPLDVSLLWSMSVPTALFDLCLYLHYLFVQVDQDRLHTSAPESSAASTQSIFVPDIVYSYSMSVVRSHCGKILSLLARILSEAILFIITDKTKEDHPSDSQLPGEKDHSSKASVSISEDKENVPSTSNSKDNEDIKFGNHLPVEESEHQKVIIGTAILQFQQLSFQCQLLNLISEQSQMELSLVQSSLRKLQIAVNTPSWIQLSATYYDELPSHIHYFLSAMEYIRMIGQYLQLSYRHKDLFTSTNHPLMSPETERGNGSNINKTESFTPQQVTTMAKHWLSQIRKYRVINLLVQLFTFASDGIFALLEEAASVTIATTVTTTTLAASEKIPQRTPLVTQDTTAAATITTTSALELSSELEKYENLLSFFQLLQACFDTFYQLISIEPDLLMQLGSSDKILLVEKFVDWVIFLVFLLDKSKDLSEVLTLHAVPVPNLNRTKQTIACVSKLCKHAYGQLEKIFCSLCQLLHRLILSDMEIRKAIGEPSEKRVQQQQQSQQQLASSKIIQLILLQGVNDRIGVSSSAASVASSTSESMELELSKTILLRQKLCLLQIICLLSMKYYKDPKYKPILLSILILSSIETEHNATIIRQHKKDKMILKYLQYYLALVTRKEEEKVDVDQEAVKKKPLQRVKKSDKLQQFYELVPESLLDTIKITWLQN